MKNWKFDESFNQIQTEDGLTIVLSFGKSATKKDKALIAAAPELLEALSWAIKFVRDLRYDEQKAKKAQIEKLLKEVVFEVPRSEDFKDEYWHEGMEL